MLQIVHQNVGPMLQDSAEDLHARMGLQLPEDRWRANIVTEGSPAWSEDLWERLVVTPADGSAAIEFASVRPCDRCKVRLPMPHVVSPESDDRQRLCGRLAHLRAMQVSKL